MEVHDVERELLTAEEVAIVLGVSRWKVFEMMTRRELPSVRLGRLKRVPRHALARWIVECTQEAREPTQPLRVIGR
jgi:excisionase family DNA binding protein